MMKFGPDPDTTTHVLTRVVDARGDKWYSVRGVDELMPEAMFQRENDAVVYAQRIVARLGIPA